MSKITILGGTGYVGGAIARESSARGHEVTVFARHAPSESVDGVAAVTGSVLTTADVQPVIDDRDAVVVALAPVGELSESFPQVIAAVAEMARTTGARLGVVGGAGTLLSELDGREVYETSGYPSQYVGHARLHDAVLQLLREGDQSLDWFVLSPPSEFGSYAPGTATGVFRVGEDVLLTDAEGTSAISGADYAQAFVDEIENPRHRRQRFTVAY